MLLEMAIGDAYGAGFEYAKEDFVFKNNNIKSYIKHPKHDIPAGSYTDDTQMTLALAEIMVNNLEWTPEVIADKFVEVFKRDQREGYAKNFYAFLKEIKDGKDFLSKIRPDSDKSGAAMRSPVVGLYPDINEVIEKTRIQAAVTHNTEDGINSAIATALMVHYFTYDLGEKKDLGSFISSKVKGDWDKEWKGQVGSKGYMSVQAAITVLVKYNSLSEILKQSVAFTGDVDTVAAIAMFAGTCSKEVKQDTPYMLLKTLENKTYGKQYLIELDSKLKTITT